MRERTASRDRPASPDLTLLSTTPNALLFFFGEFSVFFFPKEVSIGYREKKTPFQLI